MPAKRRVTRQSEKFGRSPADLPSSDLPTYQDVARLIYRLKDADCIKDKQDILKIVSQELEKIWIKCNPRLILLNEKVYMSSCYGFMTMSLPGIQIK